jgi:hypothetical protein
VTKADIQRAVKSELERRRAARGEPAPRPVDLDLAEATVAWNAGTRTRELGSRHRTDRKAR